MRKKSGFEYTVLRNALEYPALHQGLRLENNYTKLTYSIFYIFTIFSRIICAKYTMLQTRYREGLDLVLKGIDCNIGSGEKISNSNFIKSES